MATPHVAGAAALVWSWMGHRFVTDADDLREIILESATQPSFLNGWVTHGMLDVHGMVLKAGPQPSWRDQGRDAAKFLKPKSFSKRMILSPKGLKKLVSPT